MEKVNIVLSRFQPFTVGHLKCCNNVYFQRGLKTVLCVINTTKTDERHPFMTKLLWSSLKALTKEYESIADVVLVSSADILKIGEAVAAKGYTVATWSCGTDRYDAYVKMCKKYAPSVEVIEIPRTDSDVSASQVRRLIREDNETGYKELTPKPFHKLFRRLREALIALE